MTTLMLLVPSLWLRDTVGAVQPGLTVNALVVTDGRNEGRDRVYAAAGELGTLGYIGEFTWSGAWSGGQIFTLPARGVFTVGDGRNDGVNRLYLVGGQCFTQFYELSWSGVAWDTSYASEAFDWFTPTARPPVTGIALGDGRRDGKFRVYTTVNTLPGVVEWSWSGSEFMPRPIEAVGSGCLGPLVVADGRGTGRPHVYVGTDAPGLFELTYSDAAWSELAVLRYLISAVTVGALRPDGVRRVYSVVGGNAYVYESEWRADSQKPRFSPAIVDSVPDWAGVYHSVITVGPDPCGSGREQLFATDGTGRVHRVYWQSGWMHEVIDSFDVQMTALAIADGRNDGVPRVYVADTSGYVYELSCTASGDEEKGAPTQPLALRTENNALRFALPAASAMTLSLYDASGRRRATLFSGTLSAGEHTFTLPELPRGVYVARLTADGRSVSVTLVR